MWAALKYFEAEGSAHRKADLSRCHFAVTDEWNKILPSGRTWILRANQPQASSSLGSFAGILGSGVSLFWLLSGLRYLIRSLFCWLHVFSSKLLHIHLLDASWFSPLGAPHFARLWFLALHQLPM